MTEKIDQFSTQDLAALASSPAGQQLLGILQQSGGTQLQQAMVRAAAGDMTGAKDALTPLLADPRIRTLLEQIGGL